MSDTPLWSDSTLLVQVSADSRGRYHVAQEVCSVDPAGRYENPARFEPDELASAFVTLRRRRIRRVLAFMEANLAKAIRVEDLAAAAYLSVSHFSRVFRWTVGEPPSAYLRRRRIERAQQLMLSTEKSIADIAGECGLADQAHLTRWFRRVVGITPAAWRRLRRA